MMRVFLGVRVLRSVRRCGAGGARFQLVLSYRAGRYMQSSTLQGAAFRFIAMPRTRRADGVWGTVRSDGYQLLQKLVQHEMPQVVAVLTHLRSSAADANLSCFGESADENVGLVEGALTALDDADATAPYACLLAPPGVVFLQRGEPASTAAATATRALTLRVDISASSQCWSVSETRFSRARSIYDTKRWSMPLTSDWETLLITMLSEHDHESSMQSVVQPKSSAQRLPSFRKRKSSHVVVPGMFADEDDRMPDSRVVLNESSPNTATLATRLTSKASSTSGHPTPKPEVARSLFDMCHAAVRLQQRDGAALKRVARRLPAGLFGAEPVVLMHLHQRTALRIDHDDELGRALWDVAAEFGRGRAGQSADITMALGALLSRSMREWGPARLTTFFEQGIAQVELSGAQSQSPESSLCLCAPASGDADMVGKSGEAAACVEDTAVTNHGTSQRGGAAASSAHGLPTAPMRTALADGRLPDCLDSDVAQEVVSVPVSTQLHSLLVVRPRPSSRRHVRQRGCSAAANRFSLGFSLSGPCDPQETHEEEGSEPGFPRTALCSKNTGAATGGIVLPKLRIGKLGKVSSVTSRQPGHVSSSSGSGAGDSEALWAASPPRLVRACTFQTICDSTADIAPLSSMPHTPTSRHPSPPLSPAAAPPRVWCSVRNLSLSDVDNDARSVVRTTTLGTATPCTTGVTTSAPSLPALALLECASDELHTQFSLGVNSARFVVRLVQGATALIERVLTELSRLSFVNERHPGSDAPSLRLQLERLIDANCDLLASVVDDGVACGAPVPLDAVVAACQWHFDAAISFVACPTSGGSLPVAGLAHCATDCAAYANVLRRRIERVPPRTLAGSVQVAQVCLRALAKLDRAVKVAASLPPALAPELATDVPESIRCYGLAIDEFSAAVDVLLERCSHSWSYRSGVSSAHGGNMGGEKESTFWRTTAFDGRYTEALLFELATYDAMNCAFLNATLSPLLAKRRRVLVPLPLPGAGAVRSASTASTNCWTDLQLDAISRTHRWIELCRAVVQCKTVAQIETDSPRNRCCMNAIIGQGAECTILERGASVAECLLRSSCVGTSCSPTQLLCAQSSSDVLRSTPCFQQAVVLNALEMVSLAVSVPGGVPRGRDDANALIKFAMGRQCLTDPPVNQTVDAFDRHQLARLTGLRSRMMIALVSSKDRDVMHACYELDAVSFMTKHLQQSTRPVATQIANAPPSVAATAPADLGFAVGDNVMGQVTTRNGKVRWFPAHLDRLHGDGTCELTYKDGDREERKPLAELRPGRSQRGGAGPPNAALRRQKTAPHAMPVSDQQLDGQRSAASTSSTLHATDSVEVNALLVVSMLAILVRCDDASLNGDRDDGNLLNTSSLRDADGALDFLHAHLSGKSRSATELLELPLIRHSLGACLGSGSSLRRLFRLLCAAEFEGCAKGYLHDARHIGRGRFGTVFAASASTHDSRVGNNIVGTREATAVIDRIAIKVVGISGGAVSGWSARSARSMFSELTTLSRLCRVRTRPPRGLGASVHGTGADSNSELGSGAHLAAGAEASCGLLDYGFDASTAVGARGGRFMVVMPQCKQSLLDWRHAREHNQLNIEGADGNPDDAALYVHIFKRVARAVEALASANVVHFDLKCANVLLRADPAHDLSDACVCLADFGEAIVLPPQRFDAARNHPTESTLARARGTECVQSPEALLAVDTRADSSTQGGQSTANRDTPGVRVGLASDVWSLGCLLYELLTTEPLFDASDFARFFVVLTTSVLPCPPPERLTRFSASANGPALVGLLRFVLIRNPTQRPTAAEVRRRARAVLARLHARASFPWLD